VVALGGHGNPPLRWDYVFRVHRQKPRSLRKLAMTNKRVVIAIVAQRREAISGGNMRSRRKLAMTNKRVVIAIGAQRRGAISGGYMRSRRKLVVTNFVFFASFVVQNRVNHRIDASSPAVLICRSPVGATLRGCPGRTWLDTLTGHRECYAKVRPYDGIIYFRCITGSDSKKITLYLARSMRDTGCSSDWISTPWSQIF